MKNALKWLIATELSCITIYLLTLAHISTDSNTLQPIPKTVKSTNLSIDRHCLGANVSLHLFAYISNQKWTDERTSRESNSFELNTTGNYEEEGAVLRCEMICSLVSI